MRMLESGVPERAAPSQQGVAVPRITGPIKRYTLEDGTDVPFYAIKFDKDGNCTSPRSLSHLVDALAGGE